ncbi:MAG: hypothetical protein R2932_39890 [Caldilineaceae bacterium]
MDAVIEKLRNTDPTDYQAVVDVGIRRAEAIADMPSIPTYGYVGFVTCDSTGQIGRVPESYIEPCTTGVN